MNKARSNLAYIKTLILFYVCNYIDSKTLLNKLNK